MTDGVLGRGAELEAAGAAFDHLGSGPMALLIEGPEGIGKTAFWHAAIAQALDRGARLLTTRSAEAEARLAFSGLADLLHGLDNQIAALPTPQRRAIDLALLRAEPDDTTVDPRAVAAGTTTILRGLAGERPLVVALDDAQWLDSTTVDALMFAARRLGDAPVGFVATVRTPVRNPAVLLGLAEALPNVRIQRVVLGPLGVGSLYHLFVARLGRELPRSTIERIAETSGGNPFHALEIARQVVAGGPLDAAAPLPVPASVLDAARDRIRRLPPATRAALLRVAALNRPTTAGLRSATRCSARPCTATPLPATGGWSTPRWPRSWRTPRNGPATRHSLRPAPMPPSPPASPRPAAGPVAVALRPPQRSSPRWPSASRRSRTRTTGSGARSSMPRTSTPRASRSARRRSSRTR
jgi:hypothetical protein